MVWEPKSFNGDAHGRLLGTSTSQDIRNIHLMSLQDSDLLDSDAFEISDFLCLPLPSAKSKCFDKTSNDLSTRKSMARAVGLEISQF